MLYALLPLYLTCKQALLQEQPLQVVLRNSSGTSLKGRIAFCYG